MKDSNLENLLKVIATEPLQEDLTIIEREFFHTIESYRLKDPRIYHVYTQKYVEIFRSKELSKWNYIFFIGKVQLEK